MKKYILVVLILIVFVSIISCLQQKKHKNDVSTLNSNYFNLKLPGDTAVIFAPGIVSTSQHEHSRIQFTNKGTEMFWAVIPTDTNYKTTGGSLFKLEKQNIWYARMTNDKWTKPAIFDITKTNGGSSPALFASDHMFYYRTFKPDADSKISFTRSQLWEVSYEKGRWGEPTPENDLLPNQEGKTFMSFCFSDNGNLYFDYGGPDETGEWQWDIYFSKFQNGGYLAPVKMRNGINDGKVNWCPWIAPDESYIIYSSSRDGEFGRGDLYINFKDRNENWSGSINMGRRVNSEMQERFPSISPDGKSLFFARHMPETFSDIFWVDAKIIEELR